MTDHPSAPDFASTTSTLRPCSSLINAATARPSAVASPSSSSTTRARMLNLLAPRWIISLLLRIGFAATRLLARRVPHEECLRPVVHRTEPAGKQIGEVLRRIDIGQCGIDGKPEVVVVLQQREPGLFVCEQTRSEEH